VYRHIPTKEPARTYPSPPMQLELKTILNHVHKLKDFVYQDVRFVRARGQAAAHIEVRIEPRKGSKPRCGLCKKPGGCYDHQPERTFMFVPLWGLMVYLLYAPRRVNCHDCGVRVEDMPWAQGKSPMTTAMMCFLATWAKRMSWREVGRAFGVSWDYVCNAVTWVVGYGLSHQDLSGIDAIGVDEIAHKKGHNFLTLVYQIDAGCRRLLWIGEGHTQKTLDGFFKWFGKERSAALKFVCSDMWSGFLKVIRRRAQGALHILDKFHIVANLNKAVDETRRRDARELRRQGENVTLKHTRWCLLKHVKNLTRKQRGRLKELLRLNLRTVRAYLLKEDFSHLWEYGSPTWAGNFLDRWCDAALRSRIEPMQRQARTLQQHRELVLNYFRARKEYSSGAVEGMNNKVKVVTRRSYGFRTVNTLKIALFHTLGRLPEPEQTHRFA
jgi:transposase